MLKYKLLILSFLIAGLQLANAQIISGKVKTSFPNGVDIPGVHLCFSDIDCEQYPNCDIVTTDTNGAHTYTPSSAGHLYVSAYKPDLPGGGIMNDPACGITAYDVHLVRRHILAIDYLDSPQQLLAADVNESGYISTFDLVYMYKQIIHDLGSLEPRIWWFLDRDYQFSNNLDPWEVPVQLGTCIQVAGGSTDVDFVGVKVGDVDGSCGLAEQIAGSISIQMTDQNIASGSQFSLFLQSDEFQDIAAFQMGIQFDVDYMRLVEIIPAALPNYSVDYHFSDTELDQGMLRTVWNTTEYDNGTTLANNEAIIELKFEAIQNMSALSDYFDLDDNVLRNRAWKMDGSMFEMNALFGTLPHPKEMVAEGTKFGDKTSASQVKPSHNPFRNQIAFDVKCHQATSLRIEILNAYGSPVISQNHQLNEGFNRLECENTESLLNGQYYYRILMDNELHSGMLIKH